MFQSYKEAEELSFEKSYALIQSENDVECQACSDFECIDDLQKQIEICWETFDYMPLIMLLGQFMDWLKRDDFQLTDSFFKDNIDIIFFNLINLGKNSREDIFFFDADCLDDFSSSTLRNLSISILYDLFSKYGSKFSQDSLLYFTNHAMPIIINWEDDFILKILDCFLLLSDKNPLFLQKCINPSILLDILDKRYTYQTHDKNINGDCIILYDGDDKYCSLSKVKSILLKFTPNLENASLFFNNGICGLKRFSLFIWLLYQNNSLITNFDPFLILPKLYEILTKSYDYSLIHPSIVFLSIICEKIKINDIIHLLIPYIKVGNNIVIKKAALDSSFDFCSDCTEDKSASNSDIFCVSEKENEMIIKICSTSLHCISRFVSNGPDEAVFCIKNNIANIILSNVNSKSCQNLIKRETSRFLCELILNTPNTPETLPTIKQFYESEDIIDLLLNILDYDEIDMDELILKSLIFLMAVDVHSLSLLLQKCYENMNIFLELLKNESREIAFLANQFLDLFQNKSKRDDI